MSGEFYREYQASRVVASAASDQPANEFYTLLMAAMRFADTVNTSKMKREWPEVWDELQARYDARGGLLEGEEVAQL